MYDADFDQNPNLKLVFMMSFPFKVYIIMTYQL